VVNNLNASNRNHDSLKGFRQKTEGLCQVLRPRFRGILSLGMSAIGPENEGTETLR
jgi:hypothetical protein